MISPATAPLPERGTPAALFMRRLLAIAQRHVFLYMGSWPRFIETLFWPMLNMLMLGFVSLYLLRQYSNATLIASVFVAGAILNEVLLRTTMGMMVMFLEEIWSRNLGHLFSSPLGLPDFMAAMMGFTFVKSLVSVAPAVIVAMYLFDFSLFGLGWPALVYSILLIMSGWWSGLLVISLLLRFGIAAEWMAWMSSWLVVPLIAPYYPVEILPVWLQPVSWALPATYVFESMKSLIGQGELRGNYLLWAFLLNILYFAGASLVFCRAYHGARRRGGLLQVGE
ncbi:MAG: ABC transporter permease [Bdellovibrionales bacterium]